MRTIFVEMLTRNGSYAVAVITAEGHILLWQDGYALEELPCYEKPFVGTAGYIRAGW